MTPEEAHEILDRSLHYMTPEDWAIQAKLSLMLPKLIEFVVNAAVAEVERGD